MAISKVKLPDNSEHNIFDTRVSNQRINGASITGSATSFYGVSTSAADAVQKVVSVPSITSLDEGTVIVVQPTITSTVASSTIKLNDFDAYPMSYNNAAVTTSTDSIVWNANYPSAFIFTGTHWVFLAHGIDSNTTYTLNYSIDAGRYRAGVGTYAVTRYSLLLQKPDFTWEKTTATSANYSTGTSKSVNTNGFLLNQIRYYGTTTNVANGALIASNVVYSKGASINLSYSTNCGTAPGWAIGDFLYLVGHLGVDGLFYLDTTTWWTTTLPTTNDGKLYIRLGIALTTTDATISFFDDRPIFYHNGTEICRYIEADNKQDVIADLETIRSGASSGATAYQKPSTGIPASDLASAVQTSLGLANTALQSYTETDPTVPSWAKASNKPTYTASEVGALPDTTTIPTESTVSGWGFTKNAGTITGINMNGASKGTSGVVNLGTVVTSESDPVFVASAAYGISSTDISNWNAKQKAITVSSSEPTSSDGSNGDIWIVI